MGVISATNNTIFRDSSIMISNVKRFLRSYNAFNLINEEEFYRYIKEIVSQLGMGVYKEEQAIVHIGKFKGVLPLNFTQLYSAYKLTPSFNHEDRIHEQSNGYAIFSDVSSELLIAGKDSCEISCCDKDDKTIEKITVRNFVKEGFINFNNPILLHLSPNVKKGLLVDDSPNLWATSLFEITIDDKFVYTNFQNDGIYIKYYGLPLDPESGLPQIPNINSVEKAIEWYIIYQTLLQLWFNTEVPDIQTKWQKAEIEYKEWFAQALYEVKLPTFQSMVDKVRFNRGNLQVFRQIDNTYSY